MPHVTIPDSRAEIVYPSVTGTGPLNFTFAYLAKDDLKVRINGTLLASNAWSVVPSSTVDGGFVGGNITLNASVTAAEVIITRETEPGRTADFSAGGAKPGAINTDLDRVHAILRDFKTVLLERGIRLPAGDNSGPIIIGDATERANTIIAFGADGALLVVDRVNVDIVAGIKDNITALSDPSIVTAIQTLSVAEVIAALLALDDVPDEVIAVAGILSEIIVLDAISAEISSLAAITSDVTTLAAIVAQVAAVAANEANVSLVAADLALGAGSHILNALANAQAAETAAAATAGSASAAAVSATNAGTAAGLADAAKDETISHAAAAALAAGQALGQIFLPNFVSKSRTTTAQPASPANLDTYILPTGKTGASWAGFDDGDVVRYFANGASWVRVAPTEGARSYVQDTDEYALFDGAAWVNETATQSEVDAGVNAKKRVTPATLAGRLQALKVYDVVRHGVVVDDNSAAAANLAALQAIITASGGNAELKFPVGVVYISAEWVITEGNIALDGRGHNISKIEVLSATSNGITFQPADPGGASKISAPVVRNLTIQKPDTATAGNGLTLFRSLRGKVHNIHVKNFPNDNFVIAGGQNNLISDLTFDGSTHAAATVAGSAHVRVTRAALTAGFETAFTNYFHHTTAGGAKKKYTFAIEDCDGLTIAGVYGSNPETAHIAFLPSNAQDTTAAVLLSNIYPDAGVSPTAASFIYAPLAGMSGTNMSLQVVNCEAFNHTGDAVDIEKPFASLNFANFIVNGADGYAFNIAGAAGATGSHVTISGGHIKGGVGGIQITGGESVIIDGVNLGDLSGTGINLAAGTLTTAIINGCKASGAATPFSNAATITNLRIAESPGINDAHVGSGSFVIGRSSPLGNIGGLTPRWQMLGTNDAEASLALLRAQANANGAHLVLGKSRSADFTGFAAPNNNDEIGGVQIVSADGVDFNTLCGQFQFKVDGTPAADIVPTKFILRTMDTGGALNDVMTISAAGHGNFLVQLAEQDKRVLTDLGTRGSADGVSVAIGNTTLISDVRTLPDGLYIFHLMRAGGQDAAGIMFSTMAAASYKQLYTFGSLSFTLSLDGSFNLIVNATTSGSTCNWRYHRVV